YDNISIAAALQVTNVTIVRQDFGPQFEVGRSLEDFGFWRMDDDRVRRVHLGRNARASLRRSISFAKLLATRGKVTMALLMKASCEKCGRPLLAGNAAYICSYECTFCDECARLMEHVCPNCGGELV